MCKILGQEEIKPHKVRYYLIKKQMVTKECFGCGNVIAHRHLHDCAHGIAETHMVGSERFVCELCGHVTRVGSDGAERFPFTFDKVRRESGPSP